MDTQGNKKKRIISLVGIVVLLGILSLAAYFIINSSLVTTDDAYIAGRIHSVASKIPGTVKQVYVDDNQNVKKGKIILDIDPADYELLVNETEASLEAERVKLSDATTGIRTAQISLTQATRDKGRADKLFKENVIPKERYEKVVTAYKLGIEQLRAAKANRDLEKAKVKEKEAAFITAQRNLSYTKIYSPSDGYVANKSVESGNQIQAGQPLMAVVALDDIWVVANYKETQLKNVRPGQRVKIKVDTYPGKVFTGRIDSIMVGTGAAFSLFPPENALGNYVKVVQRIPVKIVFDKATDDKHVLRIGMSCVPSIITKDE
jgi:membrane fusion protein (multidrug efflux system)